MESFTDIYEKNRISYIVAERQKKYNFDTPTNNFYYKTKGTCYIIVGLMAMYLGIYIIIFSTYKKSDT